MANVTAKRIKLANVAEQEILKYADDDVKWHQHIHNVSIDPLQALKCSEMDDHKNTVDFSSRRTRKTSIKELYQLKWNATPSHQQLGITAPRLQQAQTNLKYHTDAIFRSEILKAYIMRDRGLFAGNRRRVWWFGTWPNTGFGLGVGFNHESRSQGQEGNSIVHEWGCQPDGHF